VGEGDPGDITYNPLINPETGGFDWNGTTFDNYVYIKSKQGWIEEFFDGEAGEYCYSGLVLIPGTTLLPKGLLAVTYLVFLCWLFLGVSIVADIFMEAIEVITS